MLETNLDDVPAEVIGYCYRGPVRRRGPGRVQHADPDEEEPARRAAERAGPRAGLAGPGGDPVPRNGDPRHAPLLGASGANSAAKPVTVQTPWGPVQGKLGWREGGAGRVHARSTKIVPAWPATHGVPLREVYSIQEAVIKPRSEIRKRDSNPEGLLLIATDRQRNSPAVHRLLRQEARPHVRAVVAGGAARRSDAAVRQRRHEPVQGRLPRHRHAARTSGRSNTQKCIRAGGKHNDLDDVGKDTYHHTFFEMLGNWSFGDYFKKEAIAWAWELLTEVWGMDKTRLHATVFEGDPDEGRAARRRGGRVLADADRHRSDAHPPGQQEGQLLGDGRHRPVRPVHRNPLSTARRTRAAASWSTRARRTSSRSGTWCSSSSTATRTRSLTPLPAKHVDTGMGFERVTAVLQGKTSNYDTDVFTPIFEAITEKVSQILHKKVKPYGGQLDDIKDVAYRVIADHLRTLTFAITDGALPGNKGRGAVLRSVLRRALRYGWQCFGLR